MRKTTKIVVSMLLVLCMLMPMAMPVFASGTASKYSGDEEAVKKLQTEYETKLAKAITYEDTIPTANNTNSLVFDIETADQLVALAGALNNKCNTDDSSKTTPVTKNTYFKGTINLKSDLIFNEGDNGLWVNAAPTNKWTMIANFAGTFNGEGHTISGLYVSGSTTTTGFIRQLRTGAVIQNLGIVNSYFKNTASGTFSGATGGIAARAMALCCAQITGCYVDAIINSTVIAGGILGCLGANAATLDTPGVVVSDCAFYGSITVTNTTGTSVNSFGGVKGAPAGGIVGSTLGMSFNKTTNSYNNLKITDCVNFGTIINNSTFATAKRNAAAGILGYAEDGKIEIARCLNFGNTIGNTANGAPYANKNAFLGELNDKALTETVAENSGVKLVMSDCYIFSEMGQNLLNSNATLTQNTPAADTIQDIKKLKGDGAKTALTTFDFEDDDAKWVTVADNYPVPKAVTTAKVPDINSIPARVDYIIGLSEGYDEFTIDSETELLELAAFLNDGLFATNGSDLTFKLTRDMTFNAGGIAEDWAGTAPAFEWTPIAVFQGTFDGQGHTVSGLYVKDGGNDAAGTASYSGGMFGVLLADATVKNFSVVNSYFEGAGEYHAGVIGRINANGVTVRDIYADVIVKSISKKSGGVGGIIGLISNPTSLITEGENKDIATLENLVFDGRVEHTDTDTAAVEAVVGGIVGHVANYRYTLVTLSDCLNLGDVVAKNGAGAIVGNGSTVILNRCVNLGTVTSEAAETACKDDALVGKITISGDATGLTINDCYNLSSQAVSDVAYTTEHSINVITKDGVKGDAARDALSALDFDGNDDDKNDWTLRSAGANYTVDQYPLPTTIYENFFKVKLVGWQNWEAPLTGSSVKYKLRLIAEVDSLYYAYAGFSITATINGTTKTLNVNTADNSEYVKVYKTVTSNTGETYTARDGKYLVTITITDLPTITSDGTFVVTTYTNGAQDNNKEASSTMTLTFDSTYNVVAATKNGGKE